MLSDFNILSRKWKVELSSTSIDDECEVNHLNKHNEGRAKQVLEGNEQPGVKQN